MNRYAARRLGNLMKIVLVDASAADRKMHRELLSQSPPAVAAGAGMEFFEAAEAFQGLQLCRTVSPDCILLEYRLPDMDGMEFLDRLPEFCPGEQPRCAVVMLTAVASERVAADALRAGAQDYLVKNRVSPEELGLAVDRAIEKVGLILNLRAERDRLTRLLAEKEILVREVHHRVKNNLQVIASLLQLESDSLGDGGAAKLLRDSENRIVTMAMIHEQLYESETVRQLDLARYAGMLLKNLFLAYGVDPERTRYEVKTAAHGLVLSADQAIPAGLILSELVSNALKHAFPDGRSGSITIEGSRGAGQVNLTVHDDGVGPGPGSDLHETKSMGLRIVHALTRQLKGTVAIDCRSGTRFQICFPEEHSKAYGAANSM